MGETYGQGSLRYFFCHGNHGDAPVPEQMTVEANIVVFTGQGRMYVFAPFFPLCVLTKIDSTVETLGMPRHVTSSVMGYTLMHMARARAAFLQKHWLKDF